ncbi:4-hydroxythreonine-4-phosphate dehydrogenase PdxA [Waterburya agarophytonicola K14]|uniref:4-hydroxythreonine-4-phosphate dehydrogenase n=1 Tax=Waterburya agarophytonicola KI4 TaxID=2874699 RepID=A0A964BS17_9CYAN|nr:4-hydroxythreonine-4-phosphate dehydrogenase PdxA [Waterburya agarophytonicola]MCC0177181.1 4-hydroxythreonine-4-phosphate dehydrogenase PdxA [Waterburya agarophytonicola KI4]
MSSSPSLAITMGDPAGIGSEIILKALTDKSLAQKCQITVVGNRQLLQFTYEHLLQQTQLTEENLINPRTINVLDIPIEGEVVLGQGDRISGSFSFACLEKAIALTLEEKFQGIITAPIAKSLWKAAGHEYPGQTEVLALRAGVDRFGMMFVGESPHTGWILRSLLATTHIPLKDVARTLTPELMSLKLDLLIECLAENFGITEPHIAIAGLNPHSGEAGQLGTEEQDWMLNWLEQAKANYPQAKLTGLIPPDTMWVNPGIAWYGNYQTPPTTADAYLALYHDQGLIPVKLMAFDRAINTTIGLPFIRTSPDHGTAFDIAGQGIANASSMKAAIELAIQTSN